MRNTKLAQEILKKLHIYAPYVNRFPTQGPCFYEHGIGYWTHQEEELQKAIDEFEKEHNATVYGVVHGLYEFGEGWDFYYFNNDEAKTVDDVIEEYAPGQYYAYSAFHDGDFELTEFGEEVITGKYGGIVRIY